MVTFSLKKYRKRLSLPLETCTNCNYLISHDNLNFILIYFSYFTKFLLKGTDHVGTFMGLKCVVYYANYRSGNQSSKIQVVP